MANSRWTWSPLPVLLIFTSAFAEAANTFRMTWSSDTFGPDGPWYAIKIGIGTPRKEFSLYPGGQWSSHVLSPTVCSNLSLGPVCYAAPAGLYNKSTSSTSSFGGITFSLGPDYSTDSLNIDGNKATIGTDSWDIGNTMQTLDGMNIAVHDQAWGTLPDNTIYPLTVGALSLGAPGAVNQTFVQEGNQPALNATLLPGWLKTQAPSNKRLSSSSYGLHIGSVSPKIPPSLYFGGFDQNRALGSISTQQGSLDAAGAIDLLDISLNVVEGASPWPFKTLNGLLASKNSSIDRVLPVAINSLAPYLHLPKSACDAIAEHLPVTYRPKYGLYFWNINDPQYDKIVSSPSCLSFTFRNGQSSNNLTINVPFALLNLTLTSPLTTIPTAYFPCKAESHAHYQLGRAFLQAAFVGVNWDAYDGTAAWWLAQAPGPNAPSQPNVLGIDPDTTTISGSPLDWASTWKGSWSALSVDNNGNPTKPANQPTSTPASSPTPGPSPALSTGAKAGIAVGVALAVIVLLAGASFFWKRGRRAAQEDSSPSSEQVAHQVPSSPQEISGREMAVSKPENGLDGHWAPSPKQRYELPS